MIVSTFDSGTSYGAAVIQYLIWKTRLVKPVVKRGNHKRVSDLIDSIHRKWKYTSGVLTFDISDDPTSEQMEEIMDSFEEYMFAGKARDTFELMWVQHKDKIMTELHFVVPRVDLETHQDLNIAPPGYADQFKVWAEKINTSYGFKNPLKQTAKSKPKQEAHTRATKRAAVYEQMVSLYEVGEIQSREDLIAQLEKVGDVRSKKANTKYISVKFEGLDNRIRFDGGIFARDFDFQKKLPGNAQRCQRSANDFIELKPRIKRALHRHELPIADPFGDQDAYLKDIEERYADAFEYRRARFEMIRNRSKRLAVIEAQAVLDEERANNALVRNSTTEDPENVDRIREARSRTRDRKYRLANLARKARNASRYAQQTFTRIGEYLRQAYERLQEFIGRREAKAEDEKQLLGYLDMVDQKVGVDEWAIALRGASRQLERNAGKPDEGVYLNELVKLFDQSGQLNERIKVFVATLPHRFRDVVADAANSVISELVSEIVTKHPELAAKPEDNAETPKSGTSKTSPRFDPGPS